MNKFRIKELPLNRKGKDLTNTDRWFYPEIAILVDKPTGPWFVPSIFKPLRPADEWRAIFFDEITKKYVWPDPLQVKRDWVMWYERIVTFDSKEEASEIIEKVRRQITDDDPKKENVEPDLKFLWIKYYGSTVKDHVKYHEI